MSRKRHAPVHELPAHYEREYLDEPSPIRYRALNETEGRGNNWVTGNLHGWDSHVTDSPCAIVYSKEVGWRTLSPELFEWV